LLDRALSPSLASPERTIAGSRRSPELAETVNLGSVDEIIDAVSDAMASHLQHDGIVR